MGQVTKLSTPPERVKTNTVVLLAAAAATGAGTTFVAGSGNKSFQVTGTFVGTVVVQVSNDNSNWETLISTTSTGMWTDIYPYGFIRANVTAFTSGTITVTMAI